jgi:hypothetical protein
LIGGNGGGGRMKYTSGTPGVCRVLMSCDGAPHCQQFFFRVVPSVTTFLACTE